MDGRGAGGLRDDGGARVVGNLAGGGQIVERSEPDQFADRQPGDARDALELLPVLLWEPELATRLVAEEERRHGEELLV